MPKVSRESHACTGSGTILQILLNLLRHVFIEVCDTRRVEGFPDLIGEGFVVEFQLPLADTVDARKFLAGKREHTAHLHQ